MDLNEKNQDNVHLYDEKLCQKDVSYLCGLHCRKFVCYFWLSFSAKICVTFNKKIRKCHEDDYYEKKLLAFCNLFLLKLLESFYDLGETMFLNKNFQKHLSDGSWPYVKYSQPLISQ